MVCWVPERHPVAAVLIYGTWNTLQCFSFLLASGTLSLSPKKNSCRWNPPRCPRAEWCMPCLWKWWWIIHLLLCWSVHTVIRVLFRIYRVFHRGQGWVELWSCVAQWLYLFKFFSLSVCVGEHRFYPTFPIYEDLNAILGPKYLGFKFSLREWVWYISV